jgi:hypothetical protein
MMRTFLGAVFTAIGNAGAKALRLDLGTPAAGANNRIV